MKRIYIFSPFVRRSTNGSSYSEFYHISLLPHPHPEHFRNPMRKPSSLELDFKAAKNKHLIVLLLI